MKNWILLLFVVLVGVKASFSQEEKKQFIHKGLLRTTATISPGYMVTEHISTTSLHGTLEYYVADNVSLRGDSYYFLKGKSDGSDPGFDFNHSILSGASYHFKTKNNFDPYFAIEPGISFTQTSDPFADIIPAPIDGRIEVNPLVSSVFGFNYYFQKWFHLFGEARYISGRHLSDSFYSPALPLNELRFSFGLGFNLSVFKPKSPS